MKQKQTELKEDIDSSTIVVGDFSTPLSIMDRRTRQKISKEIENLNNSINQLDLTDIYGTLYPTTTEYTFFSNTQEIFSKTDHILGHKSTLINFKT